MHPQIDPVALQLGPLAIHWYGLTYLAAFGLFMWLGTRRLQHPPFVSLPQWTRRDVEDILFLGVLGVVLGGRIGYCLFYKPAYYLANPLGILAVWQGGMSFHGGLLGVLLAMVWFARSRQRPWLQVMDFVAPCVPTGLAAGRVGNFINGELWGRVADPSLPWGMVFRGAGDLPRHPSQVYQFLLEGLLLFVLLWLYARHAGIDLFVPRSAWSQVVKPDTRRALLLRVHARGDFNPKSALWTAWREGLQPHCRVSYWDVWDPHLAVGHKRFVVWVGD